jgi:hypothetical protein
MIIRSIALFAPNRSSVYLNALMGMRKAFVKRGVDAHVGLGYPDPSLMAQFCDVYQPDAILEIDRTRNNAPGMPRHIVSIAWVQDWRSASEGNFGNSTDRFGGSDLYYFCVRPEAVGIDTAGLKHWGYLLQATDPEIYFAEDVPAQSDFTLIGFIPAKAVLAGADQPLTVDAGLGAAGQFGTLGQLIDALKGRGLPWNAGDPKQARRMITHMGASGQFGTVGELIETLMGEGLTWNTYDPMLARRAINRYVRMRAANIAKPRAALPTEPARLLAAMLEQSEPGRPRSPDDGPCLVPTSLMWTIENDIMRAMARAAVVNAAVSVSPSLRLYGIGHWHTYPEFGPYYRGEAVTETEVRRIYRSTRINLHNAMTQMHSRVLDCMASGSVILVNKMLRNDRGEPDCLRAHFEPGVHYFEFGGDDFAEQARKLLANDDLRRDVGEAAAAAVRAKHTWSHRVDQILADLTRL